MEKGANANPVWSGAFAKWNDRALTVHIAMGEPSGGAAGATATDFIFDRGKLISAKILLGYDFAKRPHST